MVAIPEIARTIALRLQEAGATRSLIVGGWVRDRLLGLDGEDLDLEVYGIGYREIVAALEPHHRIDLVGKSFGVAKVDGVVDVSVPRRERKAGVGHREFEVLPDPTMTPRDAAERRDYTINSIALDLDGELLDPFDGVGDLRAKRLRATSPRFADDPLRVLRGMQLAARFDLAMDEGTIALARGLRHEYATLAPERIFAEWRKWAEGGARPAAGIRVLTQTRWIEDFPELAAMENLPQDPDWHPEGDVLTHTAHVCDAAAEIAIREGLPPNERALVLFAALLHDSGKAGTTVRNDAGRWISPGHTAAGVELAEAFLVRMRAPAWLRQRVAPLVREHMAHVQGDREPTKRAVRRLAVRLHPATIGQWACVCEADHSGRPPFPKSNPVSSWLALAAELAVEEERPRPLLKGSHLLEHGLMEAGPAMGRLLEQAYEAQLDGDFAGVDDGLAWVRERLREGRTGPADGADPPD